MKKQFISLIALFGALPLIACAQATSSSISSAPSVSSVAESSAASETSEKSMKEGSAARGEIAGIGDTVYNYTIADLDGNSFSFQDLLNEYDCILLNFVYVDCPHCVEEAPYLAEAYNAYTTADPSTKYSDKVGFVGIDDPKQYGDTVDYVKTFVEENGFPYTFCRDTYNLTRYFNIDGFPTTIIIDRYGTVCFEYYTFSNTAQITKVLDHYIGDDYTETLYKKGTLPKD